MSDFATFRGSRAALAAAIREVPTAASGRGPDTTGLAKALMLRGGVALLSQIQQSFLVKARGGTGSDGIKWRPLSPVTIARRRTTSKERSKLGINKRALTKVQEAKRKEVYGKTLAELRARSVPDGEARRRAESIADTAARRAGRSAEFTALSSRRLEILRDTSVLFRSFAPGVEDAAAGARPAGQILRFDLNRVVVGTNQKSWHHKGVPGRLPARPYWPADGRLPDAWWNAISAAIGRGIVRAVAEATLRDARRPNGGRR